MINTSSEQKYELKVIAVYNIKSVKKCHIKIMRNNINAQVAPYILIVHLFIKYLKIFSKLIVVINLFVTIVVKLFINVNINYYFRK